MDTHHDHHESGGSFWRVINWILGLGFGLFALVAGAALTYGGLKLTFGSPEPKEAPVAPASPATMAGAPAAGTPAPGGATAPAGDVAEIVIKPGNPNPMSFDITAFRVKAGQKVKLTFNNESATPLQHNLVLGVIGSKNNLIAAANAMMTDMVKWQAKGFVPEGPDVFKHTALLNNGAKETLEFTAPDAKGEYPYLCTFPGHSMIMQGTMTVD